MGKREEQREFRIMQILEIALEQFIKKGFYGTSTREIAKLAGISSGLMFHYFASKEVLYETLIEIGCSKMQIEVDKDISPIRLLEKQAEDMLSMIKTNHFAANMFVFMGYATYNAADISIRAGEMLREHDMLQNSVAVIEEGQRRGEIRAGDPKGLSIAFLCSIQGIAEAIALNPDYPLPKTEWLMQIIKEDC